MNNSLGSLRKRMLYLLEKDPPPNCQAGLIDKNDLFHWWGIIMGPDDTPY